MAEELAGQVAIVTGAGRGIGRAIARRLAAAGAAVALMARSQDQLAETASLIEREGGRAFAHAADVTDRFAAELFVAETEQLLGRVDLLVNNAGSGGPVGPLWENDADEWRRCLGVNVEGPFLYARAVLPGMVARRSGRIINLVSGIALRAYPYLSAYNVAKTAVIRLTETLAAETKQHGICVFAMTPGLVQTEMPRAIGSSPEGRKWLPGFAANAAAHAQSPDRAAEFCLYLASGAADALSGRYLNVRDDVRELVRRAADIERDDLYTLRLRDEA
jgi:NAD(P)-dependent dehydrogenase (short-subunit alcohol dehydrogenase family)